MVTLIIMPLVPTSQPPPPPVPPPLPWLLPPLQLSQAAPENAMRPATRAMRMVMDRVETYRAMFMAIELLFLGCRPSYLNYPAGDARGHDALLEAEERGCVV